MDKAMTLFEEKRPKLIVSRRAIATGLASMMALPMSAKALAKDLSQLSNIPLTFNPDGFSEMMQGDMFLSDYRFPMVRLVFDNGETTRWMRYSNHFVVRDANGNVVSGHRCMSRPNGVKPAFIETCAPDKNGTPRYAQLEIGEKS